MKYFSFLLALGLVCTVGCHTRGPAFNPRYPGDAAFTSVTLSNRMDPSLLRPGTNVYRLGPGDVIEIEMMGDAQPRAAAAVGPDGRIYYSLLPGVSVWGLTLAETQDLLKGEMARYTRATPDLLVTLRTVGSKRYSIFGSVANPGLYNVGGPITMLEAISTAGGVPTAAGTGEDLADFSKSFVLRGGQFVPVDFERLLKRGDLTQNIYVQPDDVVFLRPATAANVYVLGAVRSPNVQPLARNRTLATAIITCGGLEKYAQSTHAIILRGGLTQPRIADVNYQAIVTGNLADVPLEAGDIVYVPFSPFRHLAQLTEDVLDQFVRTLAANEGRAIGGSRTPTDYNFTPPVTNPQ